MTRDSQNANRVDHVVTAFLWDGRRVLLALRSEQVSTFPNHWAGISGYVEGDDPLAWAFVEIAEETGVAREHLILRNQGPPLDVADDQGEPRFVVHPFLFQVNVPSAVRPDWEAQRFEWVEQDRLLKGDIDPTVPRLFDAFRSVWPPWPPEQSIETNAALSTRWLRNDRTMGAGQMARAAAGDFCKLLSLVDADVSQTRTPLIAAAESLKLARPSMAAPANMMEDIISDLALAEDTASLHQATQKRISQSTAAEDEVARRAADRLGDNCRMLTISYSGTVRRVIEIAANRIARVYISEGRPLLEGRNLARDLAEQQIPVTLLTDAQAFTFVSQADLVLIGADAVLDNGDVVNKAGSALLALAAKHWGTPFLVAAETLKRERRPGSVKWEESNPREEIWPDAPAGVELANHYFDRVPSDFVTEIIDEED